MSNSLLARGLRIISRKKKKAREEVLRTAYMDAVKDLPVDPKLCLLEARNGRAIDGNIYYILKELSERSRYRDLKLVLVSENEACEASIRKKIAPFAEGRVSFVRIYSREYYLAMARAGFIVNDATIPNFFIKKEGQIYLNVWHGTPLKTMGRRVSHEPHATGNVQKNFIAADYLLYPSEYMMEHMIEDYMLSNISRANILLGGYPRNTVFFDGAQRQALREKLIPEGTRAYAYMPTWRPELMGESLQNILEQIEEGLLENELMYVNVHPLARESVRFDGLHRVRPFPEDMENYAFLNMADGLLTDYSSVFYDFAVTGRKIVLLTYDEKEYFATRGLYEPISSLPFPQAEKVSQALDELRGPKTYDDGPFLKKYCAYESADAAEKLCREVFEGEHDMPRRSMPENGLPNVLVYGGDLAPGARTDRVMEYLADPGKPAANYYLTFNRKDLKERYSILFDLPEGINYIGRPGTMALDSGARKAADQYAAGKIGFDEYWKAVRPAFALERKRYYADMRIDRLVQIPDGRPPGAGVSKEELEFAAYGI